MVYTLRFFSLKCSLFHNSNLFGPCIIHILYTECAKIKKNNSGAKRLILVVSGDGDVSTESALLKRADKQRFTQMNPVIPYKFYDLAFNFIQLVVCLTTGPKPLPKRALHIVRSRASSFK